MSKYILYSIAAVVILIAYPLLIATWVTAQITPGLEAKDYLLLIQVTLTFLASVGMGVLAAANARSTVELQADLAKTVNDANEKLKSQLMQQTEDLKVRISQIVPKEHDAYHALYKAAAQCVRALRELEVGTLRNDLLKKSEEAYDEAIEKSLLVAPDDIDAFDQFAQEAQVLRDRASINADRPEALKGIWKEQGTILESHCLELRERFVRHLRSNRAF